VTKSKTKSAHVGRFSLPGSAPSIVMAESHHKPLGEGQWPAAGSSISPNDVKGRRVLAVAEALQAEGYQR